jgi:hypothetical protein
MYYRVLNLMSTDVSEVSAASIIRAARTSETSVDIQLRTRQYNPEDSELHLRQLVKKFKHVINTTMASGFRCHGNMIPTEIRSAELTCHELFL